MQIAAITRFKHGEIYTLLRRLHWTQSELARRANLSVGKLNHIVNLIRRPSVAEANAIQKAFGEAGEYLDVLAEWPETFHGLKPGFRYVQTAEVPTERLLDHPEVLQIAAPEGPTDNPELEGVVQALLDTLPEPKRHVLHERFWNGKTQSEIAKQLGVTDSAVSLAERSALSHLRHPRRLERIESAR